MSDRIEWFSVTIPPNTPKTAPITVPCVFQQGNVIEVDIKVPPGPSGNVGFFVAAGGSQYIPRTPGSFVIPDNDYITWPLANAINSGSWAVVAYNTDIYPHMLQFLFQINELELGSTSPSAQLAAAISTPAPDLSVLPTASLASADPLSPAFLIAASAGSVTP